MNNWLNGLHTDYWVADAWGLGHDSFLVSDIGIVCVGWELTVTCMHLETLIGGRGLHTKILMVFYQTWLERDSAKLKESGGWSSV